MSFPPSSLLHMLQHVLRLPLLPANSRKQKSMKTAPFSVNKCGVIYRHTLKKSRNSFIPFQQILCVISSVPFLKRHVVQPTSPSVTVTLHGFLQKSSTYETVLVCHTVMLHILEHACMHSVIIVTSPSAQRGCASTLVHVYHIRYGMYGKVGGGICHTSFLHPHSPPRILR